MFFNVRKLALIAGLMFSSTAYSQDVFGPQLGAIGKTSAECYYNDGGEFVLNGGFDTAARVCFAKTYKSGTDVIRINSGGGQNAIGLGLAHRLKGEDFHLIIEERCNSACAQYIIPLARELTLEKGAGIVIHGVLSEHFLSEGYKDFFVNQRLKDGQNRKEIETEYKNFKKFTERQIKAAEDFRGENNVKRGWYMQSGFWTVGDPKSPVDETDVEWLNRKQTAGILIDRLFLESCLPDVVVNQFIGPSDLESQKNEGYQARIKAANLTVLPHAKCVN